MSHVHGTAHLEIKMDITSFAQTLALNYFYGFNGHDFLVHILLIVILIGAIVGFFFLKKFRQKHPVGFVIALVSSIIFIVGVAFFVRYYLPQIDKYIEKQVSESFQSAD